MIRNRSMCDASYFVVIVDEYSCSVRATPIGKKRKVSDQVLAFMRWFEWQCGQPIRSFNSHGGKKFLETRKALKANGGDVSELTLYTPQSKGLAK